MFTERAWNSQLRILEVTSLPNSAKTAFRLIARRNKEKLKYLKSSINVINLHIAAPSKYYVSLAWPIGADERRFA